MGIDHLLNDTASVYRRTRLNLGGGRFRELPATPIGSEPMRSPFVASAGERLASAREETRVSHVTYCRATSTVQREDTLTFAKDPGVTYRVVARRPPSIREHHLRLDLEALQRNG